MSSKAFRRPTPKPVKVKPKRMAGDPSVEEAMAYIRSHGGVDAYPQEQLKVAIDYLRNRRQQLQDLGVRNEEELRQLGELLGGGRPVPMPIRTRGRGDNEIRTHVDFDTNPITGEIEIVPVYDPGTGKVMHTEFGHLSKLPGGHDRGTEYVGEQALKLMGINAGVGNKDRVNGEKATWRSDLVDKDTGERIDVEVRNTPDIIPQQIFTNVYPAGAPYNRMGKLINDVEQMIIEEAKVGNQSIREATESLLEAGKLEPSDMRFAQGKGIKAFPANVASREDMMDKIIMPEYTPDQEALMSWRNAGSLVMPPQSVAMVDPRLAMERAHFIRGKDIKPGAFNEGPLRVRPSEGDVSGRGGKSGHKRARVYVDLPNNAMINRKLVADTAVEQTHPLIQQLLATGFSKLPDTPF